MNRRPIHGVLPRNGRPRPFNAHSMPVRWPCHAPKVDDSMAIRRRFIDVTRMDSSKVAFYTPMPRLWFLTGILMFVIYIYWVCVINCYSTSFIKHTWDFKMIHLRYTHMTHLRLKKYIILCLQWYYTVYVTHAILTSRCITVALGRVEHQTTSL